MEKEKRKRDRRDLPLDCTLTKGEYTEEIHRRVINRFAYGSGPFHRAFSLA